MWRTIASGLRTLFRRKRADSELSEELNDFLEMAAEEKLHDGMSRNDALRAARLQHGTLDIAKENVRSAGWESFLETSWQDLRFAVRMLRKSPGFTAVAAPASVLNMILRETLALTLIGIAVGVPCAVAAARLIQRLLFNVTLYDPITLAMVPLTLVTVAAVASHIPARRATGVDPLVALRHE